MLLHIIIIIINFCCALSYRVVGIGPCLTMKIQIHLLDGLARSRSAYQRLTPIYGRRSKRPNIHIQYLYWSSLIYVVFYLYVYIIRSYSWDCPNKKWHHPFAIIYHAELFRPVYLNFCFNLIKYENYRGNLKTTF